MVMASLCLSFIACETDNAPNELLHEHNLESRSTDKISVVYTDVLGNSVALAGTYVEVDYLDTDNAELLIRFQDGTSQSDIGTDILCTAASGFVLNVSTLNNQLEVDDISIDVCSTELCYNTLSPVLSGSSLGFIIEDEPEGW